MAGNVFEKFKDSTNRAITKISVKTSSSLEKSKIKLHIDTLGKDIQSLYANIGENVYALWRKGEGLNEEVQSKLEAIRQKEEEIQRLNAEIEAIDARDNQILGTKADAAPEAAVQAPGACPNCGAEREAGARFCRKCGFNLQG